MTQSTVRLEQVCKNHGNELNHALCDINLSVACRLDGF